MLALSRPVHALVVGLTAATVWSVPTAASASPPRGDHHGGHTGVPEVQRPDLGEAFSSRGVAGTMVVAQRGRINRTVIVGDRRSRQRFLPSSTFKIPNALIALDLGIASGPDQAYPGPNPNYLVDGKPFLPSVCEGDLTLRSALQNSCIPIFQGIARQVGAQRYARYVDGFDYGNERTRQAAVDDFWLHGPFAISAREQVDFLERLRTGRLPVSRAAITGVRDILVTETTPDSTLRGKTGYVFAAEPGGLERGWWVGSVERQGQSSTFALNLDFTRADAPALRTVIGREILQQLGAFAG